MRITIHLVSRGDYWPISLALRKPRREQWISVSRRGLTAGEVAAAARKLRRRIEGTTMSRKQIDELLGGGAVLTNGVGLWLDLVRVPPSGTWERRRADLYGMAEDWVGPERGTVEEGVELLVRRYLGGFGPATCKEIANWAGLHPKLIEPALARIKLRSFESEDGEELLDLPRAPLPDPDTPAPARFLPTWDATLLTHARRTGIMPDEHRSRVFNPSYPQSVSTFLIDGAVAGTWRHEKDRIALSPFGRLEAADRRELEAEAERLAALHA